MKHFIRMRNPIPTSILGFGIKHPKIITVPKRHYLVRIRVFWATLRSSSPLRLVCGRVNEEKKEKRKGTPPVYFTPHAGARPLIPNGPNSAGLVLGRRLSPTPTFISIASELFVWQLGGSSLTALHQSALTNQCNISWKYFICVC